MEEYQPARESIKLAMESREAIKTKRLNRVIAEIKRCAKESGGHSIKVTKGSLSDDFDYVWHRLLEMNYVVHRHPGASIFARIFLALLYVILDRELEMEEHLTVSW